MDASDQESETSRESVASRIDLSRFSTAGFVRGRSKSFEIVWYLAKLTFIQSSVPWPNAFKAVVLRVFGARVGRGLYLRPGVNIHFPWRLSVGDNVWIGDRCTILNLEPVVLADNVALAHEVYLAAAGHDVSSPTFAYANRPITVRSGAWIATRAYVGPGVTIGEHAVVAAAAAVVKDVDDWSIVAGVPARVIGRRRLDGGPGQ